jgi:H+-transporting ATPase
MAIEDKKFVQPQGLTDDEAKKRLEQFGPNAMPDTTVNPLRAALRKFWAPVPWMLEAAILLQVVLGDYVEAAIVAFLLIFNAGLGFFQEGKAQATLAALKSRLALNASVRRNGSWKDVPATELVPADIVKLSVGAVVAADVKLLDGEVQLDQSMLTGESMPVEADTGTETFAGALVRRGEAVAEVTATGTKTKFGRTAELVLTAHAESTQQKAVLRVVRNLAMVNGVLTLLMVMYASTHEMPVKGIILLALTAVLASIPVALPATFTLAAAMGARALAHFGVLPTRLSAVDEAATMDVLCSDKTGTLTRNELTVTVVQPMPGFNEADLLSMAALASSDGGQDLVDKAIRVAASAKPATSPLTLTEFVPFDAATKMSGAFGTDAVGKSIRAIKGTFAAIIKLALPSPTGSATADELEKQGFRVLAVAAGPPTAMVLIGFIALSDPPRDDSSALIKELGTMGVQTIMITGDSRETATIVARAVGIDGEVCPQGPIPDDITPEQYAVYAGILPEDKFALVKSFQQSGHTVGMCGDGANDAPALRQAQMGIAVSTATDVAKTAAGIVLTRPGLSGIIASVKEGRITFQRILTYTINSIIKKTAQVSFLVVGLLVTGQGVLTPTLMVVVMITSDFLAMALTTDNMKPSVKPNTWKIRDMTIAGVLIGICLLAFCSMALFVGKFYWRLDAEKLRTQCVVALVFGGQATMYAVRGRQHFWGPRPSPWLIASSAGDILIISVLAIAGILMKPLPVGFVALILLAAVVFTLILNLVKMPLFRWLQIG